LSYSHQIVLRANLCSLFFFSIVNGVGKTNGLTVDYGTNRLYWTDLDSQSIAYTSLIPIKTTSFKTVVKSASPQLYSLSLYKDHLYWTDGEKHTIERANKETGLDRTVIRVRTYKCLAAVVKWSKARRYLAYKVDHYLASWVRLLPSTSPQKENWCF